MIAEEGGREDSPENVDSGGGEIGVETNEKTTGGAGGERTSISGGTSGGAGRGTAGDTYGREEVSALKGIFNLYDAENTGTIGVNELEGILQKVGHSPGEVSSCTMLKQESKQDLTSTFGGFQRSDSWTTTINYSPTFDWLERADTNLQKNLKQQSHFGGTSQQAAFSVELIYIFSIRRTKLMHDKF